SNPLPPGQRKAGSVGLPCGPEIAVLDRQGLPLDRGSPGEIAIRGENVTPGYEGNPKANQEAFTDGWFRTGDLGHFDEDGYLFLSGRIKEIVNRGGEKISPREIDEALLEHPDIVQAAAYPVSHPTLGEDLAAAVVLKEASHLDSHRIRRLLFEKLPGFKVPSQILIVDEIPKGPSGKIQRIGLAEKLAPFSRQDYSAPKTGLEKMLADTIGELLKIGVVGRHDNFFALGGNSILATQLISRIEKGLAMEEAIPAVTVFISPTVAELARVITDIRDRQDDSQEILKILAQIESLSDEEAARLLEDQETEHADGDRS
ncbi:MAG: non-ribosomal peptide synthetase, partial [Gammaproteobacteria bacterium]